MNYCKVCYLECEGILCKKCAKEIAKSSNPMPRDMNRQGTEEKGRPMRYTRPLPEQQEEEA